MNALMQATFVHRRSNVFKCLLNYKVALL